MKRGRHAPADRAETLRRAAEVNRRGFQAMHPKDGMFVQQRCVWCGGLGAVAEWEPALMRLDVVCLACGRAA